VLLFLGGTPSNSGNLTKLRTGDNERNSSQALIGKSERAMASVKKRESRGVTAATIAFTDVAIYIANGQYWTLQLLEGAFYVGLAALLAGISFLAFVASGLDVSNDRQRRTDYHYGGPM